MRRPRSGDAKAAALGRMLVGAGFIGVDVQRNSARVTVSDPSVAQLVFSVHGKSMPHGQTVGMVLARLRADHPYRSSVVVKCVEPEMEGALITMRLDDFLSIYTNGE